DCGPRTIFEYSTQAPQKWILILNNTYTSVTFAVAHAQTSFIVVTLLVRITDERTLFVAGKVIYQGLSSRSGLYIQVHHHHWHHNTLSEDDLTKAYGKFAERPRSPSFQQKPATIRQKKQPASDKQDAHVAELTDGPTPAPYELPAYQSYADVPPAVSQKPVFRFQVSEDVS
ncbi:hypothetical protein FMEXI_13467, partial [Fusarium mexicanum]